MSKVDWSLAPEGATHWDASASRVNSFMKFDKGSWFYWPPASDEPHWCRWGSAISQNVSDMIGRPVQSKPWSGPEDGLPPVGTVCEYGANEKWLPVTVIAHQSGRFYPEPQVVSQIPEDGPLCIGAAKHFRAIKTPEQQAADKRETAIRELMDIAQVDCRVTAARLVDAGFKREVV